MDVKVLGLDNNKGLSVTIKQNRSSEDICALANMGNHVKYYAVFDGHGRDLRYDSETKSKKHVSLYLKDYLHHYLADAFKDINIDDVNKMKETIKNVFRNVDRIMYEKGCDFGSTCSIVLVTPENVFQINLGDSRSVLLDSKGGLISETVDHDPERELERIKSVGGYVQDNRVNYKLATSRSFGDYELKMVNGKYSPEGPVSSVPDVTAIPRREGMTFVLGTDGLHDGCNVDDMVKILKSNSLRDSSAKLVEKAKSVRENDDDATAIVGYI